MFFIYNYSFLEIDSIFEYVRLSYHGLAFDTTAIFYLNSLFVVLSMLPLVVNTQKGYQKFLFFIYFVTNLIGMALNFVDLIYYKFNFSRTTVSEWDVVENESNLPQMFVRFASQLLACFSIVFSSLPLMWIFLYKKVKAEYKTLCEEFACLYHFFSNLLSCYGSSHGWRDSR